jgi:hypothetical protein
MVYVQRHINLHLPVDDNLGRLVLGLRLLPKMDHSTYCSGNKWEEKSKQANFNLLINFPQNSDFMSGGELCLKLNLYCSKKRHNKNVYVFFF